MASLIQSLRHAENLCSIRTMMIIAMTFVDYSFDFEFEDLENKKLTMKELWNNNTELKYDDVLKKHLSTQSDCRRLKMKYKKNPDEIIILKKELEDLRHEIINSNQEKLCKDMYSGN